MGLFNRKKNEYAQYSGGTNPTTRVVLPVPEGKKYDKKSVLSREELSGVSPRTGGSGVLNYFYRLLAPVEIQPQIVTLSLY